MLKQTEHVKLIDKYTVKLIDKFTGFDVIKKVNIKSLELLYQELYNYFKGKSDVKSTIWYDSWPSESKAMMERLFPMLDKHRNISWFKLNSHECPIIRNWHLDGYVNLNSSFITLSYPTTTEFKFGEEIHRPELGDLVRIDLKSVYHRTPPDAFGKPRLLIRIEERC